MVWEEFEIQVREALVHLYDPAFQPPEPLWRALGVSPQQRLDPFRTAMIQAIELLRPMPNVPPSARMWRVYELLASRYVQLLTQEETAARLGIGSRHLRREQQQAVQVLAQRLWEQLGSRAHPATQDAVPMYHSPQPKPDNDDPISTWRSQMQVELAALQQRAPGSVSDVSEEIEGIVKIEQARLAGQSIVLAVNATQPHLLAAIHPTVLRQLLVTAVDKVVQYLEFGEVALCAEQADKLITVTTTGHPIAAAMRPDRALPHSDLMQEILDAHGGTLRITHTGDRLSIQFDLPLAPTATVLVVDDNADLVHFYQRYVRRTRYQIVHTPDGQDLFAIIASVKPDVIVLDVMLPEVDGWELLMNLHENANTRPIPIIVCSVIRRDELALALGATLYLAKPVRRQEFINALDQALPPPFLLDSAAAPTS